MTKLERLKADTKNEINRLAGLALSSVTTGFPPNELLTWTLQILEVNEILPRTTISAIAASEGIEESVVVTRVKAQGAGFMAAAGRIVGKRLKLIAQVNAITDENPDEPSEETIAAIQSVVW